MWDNPSTPLLAKHSFDHKKRSSPSSVIIPTINHYHALPPFARGCCGGDRRTVREILSPSRVLLLDDLMNHRGDQLTMLLEVGRGEIEYQFAALLVRRYVGFVESRRSFLSPATTYDHSQVFHAWAKVYEGPGSNPVRQADVVLVVVQFMLRLRLPIDDLQNRIGELDD